jgi:hypothetical protein
MSVFLMPLKATHVDYHIYAVENTDLKLMTLKRSTVS